MDPKEKFEELRIERLCENLKKRNMVPHHCKSVDELMETVGHLMEDVKTAAFGGSMTLLETGVLDMLRGMNGIKLYDREEAKTQEEIEEAFRGAFLSDVYFMGTNAVSEDGILVNIDGRGNRVAALIYGPKKVVIVIGANKIVSTLDEAILRARTYAAPTNSMRLNRNTPCNFNGVCADCQSPESVCCQFVITRRSFIDDRIHVIILDNAYGL